MERQFETLESARDFVVLLGETVAEAKRELEIDVQRESSASRRQDALRIALYNLSRLEIHVSRTRRILNDLRTLRRLLFDERREVSDDASDTSLHPPLPEGDQAQAFAKLEKSMAA
jgi:hypothetical protein